MRPSAFVLVSLAALSFGVSRCGPAPAAFPSLDVSTVVTGTLSADDTDAHEGVTADAVDLSLAADQPVMVVVSSDVFAPFVIAAVRGAPLGADAGEVGARPACLTLSAPHPLEVRVYVSSAGGAAFGDYQIEARPWDAASARDLGCALLEPSLGSGSGTLV